MKLVVDKASDSIYNKVLMKGVATAARPSEEALEGVAILVPRLRADCVVAVAVAGHDGEGGATRTEPRSAVRAESAHLNKPADAG